MRCLQCGNINLEPAGACQVCGAALSGTDPDPLSPEPGVATATAQQPLTAALYQALLGPVHTEHYLQQFDRFDAAGKAGIGWHWPAFFATLGWLVFRRMWALALGFAGVSVAAALTLFGVLPLLWEPAQELLWGLAALLLLALCVLPALWANALYYQHCNRLVTQALQAAPDISETRARLAALAPSRLRASVVAALTAAVWLSLGALAAWLAWDGPAGLGLPSTAAPPAIVASAAPAEPSSATVQPPQAAAAIPIEAASAPAAPASVAAAPATAASTVPVPASAAPVAEPAAAVARSVAPKTPAHPEATASAVPGSSKQGKFIVAVGQFAQEQNASRAYDKLEAAGLPVHSNTVQTQTGSLLLIRVGPYASLNDARSAARQIKALGLPAVVMKR